MLIKPVIFLGRQSKAATPKPASAPKGQPDTTMSVPTALKLQPPDASQKFGMDAASESGHEILVQRPEVSLSYTSPRDARHNNIITYCLRSYKHVPCTNHSSSILKFASPLANIPLELLACHVLAMFTGGPCVGLCSRDPKMAEIDFSSHISMEQRHHHHVS
jgi:hypothetical protein